VRQFRYSKRSAAVKVAEFEQHALALICDEGYQSSLAAAVVARFGLAEVTEVMGGFQAWRAAGLPVESPG
jgi:rhodanese-related sulfurtransferase